VPEPECSKDSSQLNPVAGLGCFVSEGSSLLKAARHHVGGLVRLGLEDECPSYPRVGLSIVEAGTIGIDQYLFWIATTDESSNSRDSLVANSGWEQCSRAEVAEGGLNLVEKRRPVPRLMAGPPQSSDDAAVWTMWKPVCVPVFRW